MNLKRELRRSQNTLAIAGLGIIAFGVWSALKAVMYMFSDTSTLDDMLSEGMSELQLGNAELERNIVVAIYYGIIALILLIILLLHIYVGTACMAVGKRNKRKVLYIPLSFVLAAVFVYSTAYNILHFQTTFDSALDGVASIVCDISTIITMLGIVYSSVRILVIKKKLKREAKV